MPAAIGPRGSPRRATTRASENPFAKRKASIEILDLPGASVTPELDVVTALDLDGRHVPGDLHIEPLRMRKAVDEGTQIAFDRAARRGGQDSHETRVAAAGERPAKLLQRFCWRARGGGQNIGRTHTKTPPFDLSGRVFALRSSNTSTPP